MKRWGWDRGPGLVALYLGPAGITVVWGPLSWCLQFGWLYARPASARPCSICRSEHGPETIHDYE